MTRPPTRERIEGGETMLGRLVKGAVLAAIVAAVVQGLSDLKRYLKIRSM